jgi:hypothetical protein
MPTIEFLENPTLEPAFEASGATPTLNNYLQNKLAFVFRTVNSQFKTAQNKPVNELDVEGFPLTLSANAPVSFKVSQATLNVEAGGSASLDLLTGDKAQDFLKALHLDDTAVLDLISFGLTASLESGPSGSVGDLSFGLMSGQDITIVNFARIAGANLFADAAKKAISGLTLPHDLDDLRALPEGHICRLVGKGTLKFTASVQYSFLNNVLASEPLEFISQSLNIKTHAGAKLQITVEHSNTHQLTIAALPGNKIRMAVSLAAESDIGGSLDFSIGVSANIVNQDALEFILEQISPSADKEVKKLRQALPVNAQSDLSAQIKKVLEGAMKGGITASLHEALEKSKETDRLFVYEVELDSLDATGRQAVQAALRGDFTEITAKESGLAGITEIDTLSTLTLTTTRTLTIHLIGILNFSDVSSFVQKSKVALCEDTGDVVLTATEIKTVENNIDPDHLREVLLRSSMITAAAASSPASPDFTFKMVFFLRKARVSRSDLQQFCNVLQAISSPEVDNATSLLRGPSKKISDAGIYLSLNLNKDLSLSVFRNRNSDDFVMAGQKAMKVILTGDDSSANRSHLCSVSLDVWKELRAKGNRQDILELLQNVGITDPAAVVDFFSIDWWAQAMAKVAAAIAQEQPLKGAEKDALKKSEGGFDVPWALLATHFLAESSQVDSKFTVPPMKEALTLRAGGS